MSILTGLFLLVIASGYAILLVGVLRRVMQHREGIFSWLLAVMGVVFLGNVMFYLPGGLPTTALSLYLYAAALVVFGGLTIAYLRAPQLPRFEVGLWLAVTGLWWVAVLVADFSDGSLMLGDSGWIAALLESTALSAADRLALFGWLLMIVILLTRTFYAFYVARLPEIANRQLFWTLVVSVFGSGILLVGSGEFFLMQVGWAVALFGVILAGYGAAIHRKFDVRQAMQRGVFLLIVLVGVAALLLVMLLSAVTLLASGALSVMVWAALALITATLIVFAREFVGWLAGLIQGDSVNSMQALRVYSRRIAAAMDFNEVIHLALLTLVQVIKVRPGGVMLTSVESDSRVVVELMAVGGLVDQDEQVLTFVQQSSLYQHLFVRQQPVLFYDLLYNPAFADVAPAVVRYFEAMEMSAYAPIIMEGRTIGLLASGPKVNDEPFSAADMAVLAAIATQAGVALRNGRLVADLWRLNEELGTANTGFAQLDRVKTDFITIASHELRTPLAQIRGYTDILEALNHQGMLDPSQTTTMMSNLRKAAERMEELISDMLDVSKLDVDAMDLHFSQTTLEAVLRLAIDPLTDAFQTRKLSFSARGMRKLPPIEADMKRLVQALRNVIGNAVKYTPDGGAIEVRASLIARDMQPDEVHIEIQDSGIGIAPEHHDLIFEKFFRLGDPSLHSTGSTKFMGAGPGLGLTIARGMIEGHGGRLWVESSGCDLQNCPGSTFHIMLPITPPDDAQMQPFAETMHSATTEEREEFAEQIRLAQAEREAAEEPEEEPAG